MTVRWRFRSLAACSHGAASQPGAGGGLGPPCTRVSGLVGPAEAGSAVREVGRVSGRPGTPGFGGVTPGGG